ncbi:hypothetical protein V6N12_033397 [Hibiscus sabdariffa]|uniref:Uncharacterized protein n=1 Tax=Hibiscus sabdariffa TaxID=183260 RepID=A0ABR2BVF6_9ROSI
MKVRRLTQALQLQQHQQLVQLKLSPQTFVVGAGAGAGVGVDEGSPLDTGPATATTSAIGAAEGSPSATTT